MNEAVQSPLSRWDELIGAIAAEVGTPFWLYDTAVIERQVRKLQSFDTLRFAQKANSNLAILKVMRRNGVLVDAVSIGEVDRAMAAGYALGGDPAEIVFTADLISRETLERLAALRIPVNCGSIDMIAQIGRVSPGHPVWLRLNPGFGHGHSAKTNTGGPLSKHGIWHTELPDALAAVEACGAHLVGLHMHIGSGAEYSHLARVAEAMVECAKGLARPIEAISAGGGLSVQYAPGDAEIDSQRYFSIWDEARKRLSDRWGTLVRLEIEPGRFLVANAGQLVAEVRAVKSVDGNVFVLLDAGFSDLMRPMAYGSFHHIRFVTSQGAPVRGAPVPVAVAGPLCESGDVFTQEEGGRVVFRTLPVPAVGDFAVIEDAGAYGASMSSNYNSRPLIPEVMIDGGAVTLIRRRQSIQELLQLEDPSILSIPHGLRE
ncbi:MAG TPA: diaminopimelate decarboxylase [Magnetospirillaceae bacterium]|jgi:diaminopimelate decarboxylase